MRARISKPLWTRKEKFLLMNLWLKGKSNREIAEAIQRTELAVVTKLSRMGMRRPTIRRPIVTTIRPCLSCGEEFPSTDSFNRICSDCKNKAGWDDNGTTIQLGNSKESIK